MSKLAIVVTAAVCIPLGVVIGRPVLAQKRIDDLQPRLTHFDRAQRALRESWIEIQASLQADEPMWNDAAGHAVAAMGSIEVAMHSIDRAATWACAGGLGLACRRTR